MLAVAGFSRVSLNYLNYFVFVNRALYYRNLIFPMCSFVFPTILISCLYFKSTYVCMRMCVCLYVCLYRKRNILRPLSY